VLCFEIGVEESIDSKRPKARHLDG